MLKKSSSYKELLIKNKELKHELEQLKKTFVPSVDFESDIHKNPLAIIGWDLNFQVTNWNKAAEGLFGYTKDEAIGKHATDLIVPKEVKEDLNKQWYNLLKDKSSLRTSSYYKTKAGNSVYCEWYNTPVVDEHGKITSVKSFIIDITKSKKAENELFESEERFKALSKATFEAIFILDNGYCIEANEAGCNLFGYSYHEIIGMHALDVMAEESKEIIINNFKIDYQKPYEVVCIRKDGSRFLAEGQGKNINYKGKEVRVSALRDISDRKRIEQELKESENKFRAIFEHAGDGILIGDNNGTISDANESICFLLGYNKKEIVGKHISTLFSPESLQIQPLRFETLDEGKSVIIEREILSKKGIGIPIEMNSKRLDENYYISVIRDFSERKKVEKELKDTNIKLVNAKNKAEESDQLKSEFLANLSHEIRTPMNGILGFAEILKDPLLEHDKLHQYINIIINSSYQLKNIIDDIIEISVLETKQVKIANDKVCLNDVLMELFNVYDTKAKENKTPIYIQQDLNDLKSTIYTDELKLRKILNNLIDNSLHYTTKGYIETGYKLKGEFIEFFVTDTGIGISKDKQESIFERFSQEEKALNRSFGGLGLGLSIAKENTELLGGKIWVESEKEKGSKFFFTIPYKPVHPDAIKPEARLRKTLDKKTGAVEHKILIAEDEEINFIFYRTVLIKSKINCKLLHAKNGREAIEYCRKYDDIDIVLMDIKMPEIDGFQATSTIKGFRPDLKIIAQTAYSTNEDRNKALEAGCIDFISKPIERESLVSTVMKHLDIGF